MTGSGQGRRRGQRWARTAFGALKPRRAGLVAIVAGLLAIAVASISLAHLVGVRGPDALPSESTAETEAIETVRSFLVLVKAGAPEACEFLTPFAREALGGGGVTCSDTMLDSEPDGHASGRDGFRVTSVVVRVDGTARVAIVYSDMTVSFGLVEVRARWLIDGIFATARLQDGAVTGLAVE